MYDDMYVLIAMDWCSDPTWNKAGANTDYLLYPISEELKQRMKAWSVWHDKHNFRQEADEWTDYKEFYLEGVLIAQEFKRQNPDWEVWTYIHLPARYESGQEYDRVEVVLSNQIR